MTDIFTQTKRSDVMSKIRSKNTKPEIKMRRLLSNHGVRYKLHAAKLPGKPDITIKRLNLVIRINGCFWHNHKCRKGKLPATRTAFWTLKVTSNADRDLRDARKLRAAGWSVWTVWECELSSKQPAPRVVKMVQRIIEMDRKLSKESRSLINKEANGAAGKEL